MISVYFLSHDKHLNNLDISYMFECDIDKSKRKATN